MKKRKKFLLVKYSLIACIIFLSIAAVGAGIMIWNLPSVNALKKYIPAVTTEVYSKEYIKIGEFFDERRVFVPFEKIPPMLINAFISAEDSSFYEHKGISFLAILRAAVKNVEAGYKKQGGSTITQQVARGLLLSPKKDYTRKVKEIILAILMEKYLSKQDILEIYLNQVYLGQSSYGVQAASHVYFGKDVQDLSLAEIAVMAGLTKAPSRDNPAKDLLAAKKRQAYVLQRLREDKHILPEEAEAAMKEPLQIEQEYDLNHQIAPYFVEAIRQYVMNKYGSDRILKEGLQIITTLEFKAAVAANRAVEKGVEALDHRRGYRGPIKHFNEKEASEFLQKGREKYSAQNLQPKAIFEAMIVKVNDAKKNVDIDLGFIKDSISFESFDWMKPSQLHAQDLIMVRYDGAKFNLYQEPQVQGSLIAMNPVTGEVTSMVGGYNFKKSEFNRATQGKRQPGSSFKPIIYTAALDHGFTPASIIVDAPIIYEDTSVEFEWKPQNYGGKFYGDTIFRDCLILSRNIPTIKIVQQLGMDTVIDYAGKMGITSTLDRNLSLALGSSIVSPLELITAYSVLASGGKKPTPIMIKKITDRNGNVLEQYDLSNLPDLNIEGQIQVHEKYEAEKSKYLDAMNKGAKNEPLPDKYVVSPQTSYIMTNLLKEVITSGTGHKASTLGRPAAGKTGTTNDNFDAWFVGFTPNLVAAVWFGFDEAQSLGAHEEGGQVATPVWLEFMQQTLDGKPVIDFQVPSGLIFASIDTKTGKLSNDKTLHTVTEVFKEGTEPKEVTTNSDRPNSATDFFLDE